MTQDIFLAEPERVFIDWIAVVARQKVGGDEAWLVARWERIGDTNDLKVGIGPARDKLTGKNKGLKTWRDTSGKLTLKYCVVTEGEIQQAMAAYEARTGNCSECEGTGSYCYGWSAKEGNMFRPCSHCGASGKAGKGGVL